MPCLDGLPSELLSFICSCLDNGDLKSLSLVSKNISPAPRRALLEVVAVILWKDEWSEFVELTNHRSLSHGYVRQLRFHVQSPTQDWKARFFSPAWLSTLDPSQCSAEMNQSLKRPRELCLALWKEYEERQNIIRMAFEPDSLRNMMRAFPKLDSIMLVSDGRGNDHLNSAGEEKRPGIKAVEKVGFVTSETVVGYHPRGPKGQWYEDPFINLERGIDQSVLGPFVFGLSSIGGHTIKELDIGDICEGPHSYTPSSMPSSAWKITLEAVEKLSLFAWGATLDAEPTSLASFPQMVAEQASTNLRELRLGWHQEQWSSLQGATLEFGSLDRVLKRSFPYLRLVALCGFEVDAKRFKHFLKQHQATLKRLDLYNILLISSDGVMMPDASVQRLQAPRYHVRQFFVWIAENLSLQQARISGEFWSAQRTPEVGDMLPPPQIYLGRRVDINARAVHPPDVMATDATYRGGLSLGFAIAAAAQPMPDTDTEPGGFNRATRVKWIKHFFAHWVYGSGDETTPDDYHDDSIANTGAVEHGAGKTRDRDGVCCDTWQLPIDRAFQHWIDAKTTRTTLEEKALRAEELRRLRPDLGPAFGPSPREFRER